MKKIIVLFLLSIATAQAELPSEFVRAIHMVETSGRHGAIKGDQGKALGPLQIHKAYWIDSGVAGSYNQCADLNYSKRVMEAYLRRYAPKAVKAKDFQTLARIHNGGLTGHKKSATISYWYKVKRYLN